MLYNFSIAFVHRLEKYVNCVIENYSRGFIGGT